MDLARRVAPDGYAVGVDLDDVKVRIAREEAAQQGVKNVDFRLADAADVPGADEQFDVVYARFLLTHLSDPAGLVRGFYHRLRPGGLLAIEDIDFSGHFTWPGSKAFLRYHELYCASVVRRGGDPNVGLRLPGLVTRCGFADVGVAIAQPVGLRGDAKLINALTMEAIAGAVLADGLASHEEIDRLVEQLYEFAADPETLAGLPRVVQVWGRRPSPDA